MGSKKHKDKDREHRHKHKHRDGSRSKDKHRSKKSRSEKEERRARKKAAQSYLAENDHDHHTRDESKLVTEIDYGHGYQQPEAADVTYAFAETNEPSTTAPKNSTEIANETPTQSHGSDNALSIIETNKLRAKLGLKPLDVGIPGVSGGDVKGKQEDIHVPAVNMAQVRRTEKIKERTDASRGKRQYEAKLSKIKGLGDTDSEGDDDAFGWVKRSRIKQKERELASKREKILDEMDAAFGLTELVEEEFSTEKKQTYSEKDLQGMTVQHTLDRFKDGSSVIMTLDDKKILDDDGDVLINVNMADDERLDKNLENKKRGPSYNPYDEANTDEFGMAKPATVLSKYDEEIDGTKKESFQLGSKGKYTGSHEKAMSRIKEEFQNQKQSLLLNAPQLASEYYTAAEMDTKFKRKKKSKRKIRDKAVVKADDLLPQDDDSGVHHGSRSRGRGVNMESDDVEVPDIKKEEEMPGEVEETSQAAYMYYASGGGEAWPGQEPESNPRLQPLGEVKEEGDSDSDGGPMEDLSGVIVDPDDAESELQAALDKTRRLKQNLYRDQSDKKVYKALSQTRRPQKEELDAVDKKNSIVMNSISEFCRSLGDIPTYGQSGNREDDEDMMDFENEAADAEIPEEDAGTGWNEVDIDTKPVDIMEEDDNILNDEPIVNKGIGTALNLAVQKGYLEQEFTKTLSAQQKSKIQVENYSIEDKHYDDLDEKSRKRERGPVGLLSDFKDKSGYKPDIKLEYVDDKGNMLSNKEAFRYLSHRFHGKGSGKKKTEKRGKKFEEDLLMKSMSSIDTPLGTLNLLKQKQISEKSPFVILTGVSSNKAFMANTITK